MAEYYEFDKSIVERLKAEHGEANIVLSPPIIDMQTCDWAVAVLLNKDGKTIKLRNVPVKRFNSFGCGKK